MALKEGVIAVPLMIPLLIITILFGIYIREKHFLVAMRLPTRLCLQQDRKTRHWVDFSFVRDAYLQPEMREKEAIPNVSRDRLRELGLGGDEEKEMVASPKNDFNSYQTTTPHGKCRVTRLNVPHDIVDEDKQRGKIPEDEEPELVVNIENDSPVESVATEGESVSSP